MAQIKSNLLIGKRTFTRYSDEYNDLQINFIPIYFIEDQKNLYIGVMNDMVGTQKGSFPLNYLIGTNQINSKYLSKTYKK